MTQDDRMETITDPAQIRATDEPDERTTPAPVGAAVALDLDCLAQIIEDKGVTTWSISELEYVYDVQNATADEVIYELWPALVAEVRRKLAADNHYRAESAEAEVVTLRARLAEGRRIVGMLAETVESECEDDPEMCHEHDRTDDGRCPLLVDLNRAHAALAVTTGEGEHVAREVFTADGIPFVRCSCTSAKSPTSSRWLAEHVPNGGVAELQAVVKRQAEGAKA
jgi:hypothetical protein